MGNVFGDAWNAGTGAASDMWNSATGGNTRAQEADAAARADAAKAAEQRRKDLAAQQRGLHVEGTDPASITQHDNWNDWDHQRLATQLKESLQPDQINASGRAWEKLGGDVAELFADLDKKAREAAGDGMRGQAAEAGLAASQPLQQWGQSFGDSVRMTGLKVQEAGVAAEQTKAAIQPPNEGGTARAVLAGGANMIVPGTGAIDSALQMKERQEDEKRARAIAENVYTPGYTTVDTSTPTLPPPVNPLNPPPPPPPPPPPINIPGDRDPSISGRDPGGSDNPPRTPTAPGDRTPGGDTPSGRPPVGNTPTTPPGGNGPSGSDSQWSDTPRTPSYPGYQPPGPGQQQLPGSQPPNNGYVGVPPGPGGRGPGGGPGGGGGTGVGRGGGSGVGGRTGGSGVGPGGRAGIGGVGAAGGA
ncbi:hypothetical protein, partial [Saccharopolyspora taberi]|uniref:hypothetical protein n=1 Tax=Saccharopolyspora taberi TaxID=60895 RepID=UPI0031E15CE3